MVLGFQVAAPPAVRDAVTLSAPGEVELGGMLQARYQASLAKRLRTIDGLELVAGFQARPGKQAWIGEHVGKWLDAACAVQAATRDAELGARIERVRDALLRCQEPDGYLGTYTADQRFGLYPDADWDVWVHKYVLLGLLAEHRRSGHKGSLAACRKIGDLLCATFGDGKRDLNAAGQHVGMAATSVLEPMVLLHRVTGEAKYLAFAQAIVRGWERPGGADLLRALLAKKPVCDIANGKAYEMLSNLIGLCELYRQTGEQRLLDAVLWAWQDITAERLLPSGSGSTHEHWNKQLPVPVAPEDDVAETCVTVTWLQLNVQLLRLLGEARFGDEIEKTVYNHLLAAQRPDGAAWCYFTPLQGTKVFRTDTNCCLSSGPRGLALLPGIAVTHDERGVQVNLFGFGRAEVVVGGVKVVISEGAPSDYPWVGGATLRVRAEKTVEFPLAVRIPPWVRVPEAAALPVGVTSIEPGRYLALGKAWSDETVVLPMEPKTTVLDGNAFGRPGRAAVCWGPFVLACQTPIEGPLGELALLDLPQPLKPVGAWDGFIFYQGAYVRHLRPGHGGTKDHLRLEPVAQVGWRIGRTQEYRVWFRRDTEEGLADLSRLAFGEESGSRRGNQPGSITDGDDHTFRVTWDKTRQDQDWYSVHVRQPVTLGRISFRHGHTFHDGGWFDVASGGKPRAEIQTEANGPWLPVGEFKHYPATTATEAQGLRDGQLFSLTFAPREVVGVRIVGRGASGDDPSQCFSSCAEVEGWRF